jgi:hypothetical protein
MFFKYSEPFLSVDGLFVFENWKFASRCRIASGLCGPWDYIKETNIAHIWAAYGKRSLECQSGTNYRTLDEKIKNNKENNDNSLKSRTKEHFKTKA